MLMRPKAAPAPTASAAAAASASGRSASQRQRASDESRDRQTRMSANIPAMLSHPPPPPTALRVHPTNGMTPTGRVAAAVLALFLAGCAAHAGGAGAPEPSVSAGGVEISATANAWRGWPAELGRVVTPVRVRLANRGATPVRVDATTFALALPEGGRRAAMLPADVRGVAAAPAPAALPHAGAALGPRRERSGAGWALNEPALDPLVDPSQESDRAWELPTADMLSLALPEGVPA